MQKENNYPLTFVRLHKWNLNASQSIKTIMIRITWKVHSDKERSRNLIQLMLLARIWTALFGLYE